MNISICCISDIAEINPRRFIKKGDNVKFIDMAALSINSRDIVNDVLMKEFSGGGSKFCNGDTLLARITPCLENGKTALVNNLAEGENGHGSTEFIVLSPKYKFDAEFLYYLVRSEEFRIYAIGRMEGTSGRQRVSASAVQQYKFQCPSPRERKEIGRLLGSLDDRITLLRETNKTLEAIAQALFKSWFVDFDPVRAKMENRMPEGMDEETAALFPDSLEESELGMIPKGWKVSTVGNFFILLMGQSPSGDTYNERGNGLPFYQGCTDFGFRFPTKRMYCSEPTRIAEIGDTLVSVRAPVGDVNMAIEKCCIGRGVASVRHKGDYRSFTFYSMKSLKKCFDSFDAEGTIFGSITKKDFLSLLLITPSNSILEVYDSISKPIDDGIINNEQKIRNLSNLRDTLLPRLISGKMRVGEVEV